MVGFGANRRGGRLPSLILIFLMVLIVIVSYNYWSVSRQHGRAVDELAEAQAQVKRTDAARSRLEKRNSELMLQVDTHRRQIDQKDGDYTVLESKLQARDALVKKCGDEKMKLQNDFTLQSSEISKLKEQVQELKQEIIRQEDQLRELKKNNTNLERKLEYESLQCGRQLAQLKDEYEESRKSMQEQVAKTKQGTVNISKTGTMDSRAEKVDAKVAGERKSEAQQHDNTDLKEEMGKPGSDAGMPGIEDSEVGKVDDMHFALKKPAITQNHGKHADQAMLMKDKQIGGGDGLRVSAEIRAGDMGNREGEGAGIGAGFEAGMDAGVDNAIDLGARQRGGIDAEAGAAFDAPHGLPLEHPDLPLDGGAGGGLGIGRNMMPVQQQVPQPVVDRPVVLDENNKADEFGEQHGQMRGHEGQAAALLPPPNPAHVLPNPIEPRRDPVPLRHRQSRFFDENESPVDPQRASKLADYNGDDGNVGEYEADKQAELAYNEEEDGDGGEEDAQDDEDREVPGDNGVDYGKRHQAIDIL